MLQQFPFGGTGWDRWVWVRARATGAKSLASVMQAYGRSLKSEYSKVRAVVAPWWPVMLSKILSLKGGGCKTDMVWKWLQILYYHTKSWSIKCTWSGANFKYHSRTSHCPHPFAPVSSTILKTSGDKFYTENKRAVAGVGTAVLGFSAVSHFAFHFDKNNLGWGRKKTRDVSVTFKVTGLGKFYPDLLQKLGPTTTC